MAGVALAGSLLVARLGARDVQPHYSQQLQLAYEEMYNLHFGAAKQKLTRYKQEHPDDPMGPLSFAAMYMLEQFNRLGVLRTDFASHGKVFGHKPAKAPDPELEKQFHAAIEETRQSARAALSKSQDDADALLALALADTLLADYDALIKDDGKQALAEIEAATRDAHHLLSLCPTCFDANLASGVENYILGQQSGVAKLFLDLSGAQTNEQKGLDELKLVAAKGRYFKAYAKVLLALAALRQNQQGRAKEIMVELVHAYPNNDFFRTALKEIA